MASICLNELTNYNNGNLVYKWFDLDNHDSAEEYHEAVREWLASCTSPHGGECEEWNIGDVDGIPDACYDDYTFKAEAYYEYKAICDEVGEEKLDAWLACFHQLPENAACLNEQFIGATEYPSDEYRGFEIEIGVMMAENNGLLNNVPEEVSRYFDFAKYGRDQYSQTMAMHNGYIFYYYKQPARAAGRLPIILELENG